MIVSLKQWLYELFTPYFYKSIRNASKKTISILPLGDDMTSGLAIPGGYREHLLRILYYYNLPVQYIGPFQANSSLFLKQKHATHHAGFKNHTIAQLNRYTKRTLCRSFTQTIDFVLLMTGLTELRRRDKPQAILDYMYELLVSLSKLPSQPVILVSLLPPFIPHDELHELEKINQGLIKLIASFKVNQVSIDLVDNYHFINSITKPITIHTAFKLIGYAWAQQLVQYLGKQRFSHSAIP